MTAPARIDVDALGLEGLESLPGGVLVGRRGFVAVVLLDRPEKGNAFDGTMIDTLGSLWARLGADPAVRAIVLGSTNGRFFCTGRDVTELDGLELPSPRATYEQDFAHTARRVGIWTPVVCAVEGRVVGAGLHFVLDADIVVASESASFSDAHVNIGLVGGVEVVGLALKAGLGNALYLTLVGRDARMDSTWAQHAGLVQEVVPDGTALDRALVLATTIAANSPAAVARTVQAGWEAAAISGHASALRHAWQLLQRQMVHPDAIEGPRAWVERRPPDWQI